MKARKHPAQIGAPQPATLQVVTRDRRGAAPKPTLRQACIDVIVAQDADAVAQALVSPGLPAHLGVHILEALAARPAPSLTAQGLAAWVRTRAQVLAQVQPLGAGAPGPHAVPTEPAWRDGVMAFAQRIDQARRNLEALQEHDAKRFAPFEDSWENLVDDRRQYRYWQYLRAIGY